MSDIISYYAVISIIRRINSTKCVRKHKVQVFITLSHFGSPNLNSV